MSTNPFWRVKPLSAMTREEWESLCDGCGKCCLFRLFGQTPSDPIQSTNIACRLLDDDTCRCTDYPNRRAQVPDCTVLTPRRVKEFSWLPPTCAYRLVAAGEDLPWWHHLVSGSHETIHQAGASARGKTVSETTVSEDDWSDYIVAWPDAPDPGPR